MLSSEVTAQLKTILADLTSPVGLRVFVQQLNCQFCREAQLLCEEIGAVSDKTSVTVHNNVLDQALAERYRIERVPAIVVEGAKDYGIRFYGIPAGHEFTSLVAAIRAVSLGQHGLSERSLVRLQALTLPLHIQVFVTLSCPYCPPQVQLAHRLALASDLISADMIEAAEFPALAEQYQVRSVPRTIVNGRIGFDGALPEEAFVDRLLEFDGESRPEAPVARPGPVN